MVWMGVVRGAGGADITIHGPPGCMDIYDATKSKCETHTNLKKKKNFGLHLV